MINPETGISQSYQELWTSASADDVGQHDPPQDPLAAVQDESAPTQSHPAESEARVKVAVAFLHRPRPPHLPTQCVSEVQGMIIRVGNHCQGIIAVPPSTSDDNAGARDRSRAENGFVRVERWRFLPTKDPSLSASNTGEMVEDAAVGNWIRDARSDYTEDQTQGTWMPCLWACEPERREGDSTQKEGFAAAWTVVEAEA